MPRYIGQKRLAAIGLFSLKQWLPCRFCHRGTAPRIC